MSTQPPDQHSSVPRFRSPSAQKIRGICALLLAVFVLALVLPHTGKLEIDYSTNPPTPHIVGRLSGSILAVGCVLFSLSCIYVSMWRRWDFEIVGWVLLILPAFTVMLR
jgi:hypothetical protein